MKDFIISNFDIIYTFIVMIITYVLGRLSKKSNFIKNKYIPIQNILIAIIMSVIYYFGTGDWSVVVASGSPVMTLIYDAFHSLEKGKGEN